MGLPPKDDDVAAAQEYDGSASPQAQVSSSMTSQLTISSRATQGMRSNSRKSISAKALLNDSIFATIAISDYFQHTTMCVIVINALWIGADTEWNHKSLIDADGKYPLEPSSVAVENVFCFYFTVEVVVRFLSFRKKVSCLRDAWFVFDSLLVTCMVLETWVIAFITLVSDGWEGASFLSNFSALRLLRLLRLTRMARLMRSVPELMTLVKGMVSATKAVFFILLFLILVMYVFAIIFTSQIGDAANREPEPETAEHMFGTLGDSMMSLFTHGVLGDNLSATLQAILDFPNGEGAESSVLLLWLFMLFFAISSMTLLNMLIGVLCEVVTSTAASETDTMQVQELRMCIEDAFDDIDLNDDGQVTESEWSQIKNNPLVRQQMECLGVKATEMEDCLNQMQKTLFKKRRSPSKGSQKSNEDLDEGLSLEDLISKVTELRPDKPASALSVELLSAKVALRDRTFKSRLTHVEDLIGQMLSRRGAPIASTAQLSALVPDTPPGNSTSSPLREIPTQLLFQEIKSRAAEKVNPGRSNYLPPKQGAVSYSAIKSLCNDLEN